MYLEIGNIQHGAELGRVCFPEIILSEELLSGNDPGQNDMFFQKLDRGVISNGLAGGLGVKSRNYSQMVRRVGLISRKERRFWARK